MQLNATNISIIKRLLGGRNSRPLKSILLKIEPPDLVQLFPYLNDREVRLYIDALMSIDKASSTLAQLPEPQLADILQKLDQQKLITLVSYCPEDDATYFLTLLPTIKKEEILGLIENPRQTRLMQLLSYPENSAGRDMNTQVFALKSTETAQAAIDRIRTRSSDESIYYVYCVNDDHHLVGVVSLRDIVSAKADTPLSQLMKRDVVSVKAEASSQDVARLVGYYDFIALPVVNEQNKLIGIITVDNVLDIIQEQATADIYATAGLQEGDRVYSRMSFSIKSRLPWMFLNLFLATVVSGVVALFESTMSQLIILASLNNIVAGIGGNTAIQTLTVITRGLATGDFKFITYLKAWSKEVSVGTINGIAVGLAAWVVVWIWKGNFAVGGVLFLSMVLNSFVAASMGAVVPLILKRFNYDPAGGSGVIVTACTDMFGFFSFLGIATLALKTFGHLS